MSSHRPHAASRVVAALLRYGKRRLRCEAAAALVLACVTWPGLPAAATARPVALVALGDSLTAGYRLPADDAFPAQLQKALRAEGLDVTVANAGVSGDTAQAGLDRLDWSVPDDTDAVIVELGANDMLRGLDPAATEHTLDAILARLQGRRIKVLLAGMLAPDNLGPDYQKRFDAIFPALARKYGVPLYPFFLQDVAQHPALELDDGMHPNAAGVAAIVKGILPDATALVRAAQNGEGDATKPD